MRKYRSKKVTVSGVTFDSRAEALRYQDLVLMERAGLIWDLQRQVPFELIPRQTDLTGKLLERPVVYKADFVYQTNSGRVVEDVKSPATRKLPEYILKRKLMLWVHGIRIKEVLNA